MLHKHDEQVELRPSLAPSVQESCWRVPRSTCLEVYMRSPYCSKGPAWDLLGSGSLLPSCPAAACFSRKLIAWLRM